MTTTYGLSNIYGPASSTVTITVIPRPDPMLNPDQRALTGSQAGAAKHSTMVQLDNFNHRLEQLHRRGSDGSAMNLSLAPGIVDNAQPMIDRYLVARQGYANPDDDLFARTLANRSPARQLNAGEPVSAGALNAVSNTPRAVGSIGAWAGGVITIGARDASTGRAKMKVSSSGLSAGLDLKLAESLTIGVGGGSGQDLVKVGSDGSKLKSDTSVAAIYASYLPTEGMFLDGVSGLGRFTYDLRRSEAGATNFALAKRDGTAGFASLTGGIDRTTDRLRYSLYSRVSFLTAELGSYVETGVGTLNLAYAERSIQSLVGTLGGKWEYQIALRDHLLSPRLRVEAHHEFEETGQQTIRYADWLAGPAYTVAEAGWAKDRLGIGLGVALAAPEDWRVDLELGGEFGADQAFGMLKLEGAVKF